MENFIHYNWEIVGPGWIAHDMANALIQEDVGVYGVASGHYSSTKKFFEEFSIKHVYENYEIMKDALLHNKHVFSEKAIIINSDELEECVEIVKERHLAISDGVTLFHMPLFKE